MTKHPLAENSPLSAEKSSSSVFPDLQLNATDLMDALRRAQASGERIKCRKCLKSFKFYCAQCCLLPEGMNHSKDSIELPVKLVIIKHRNELASKSTALHAKILAPSSTQVFEFSLETALDLNDELESKYGEYGSQCALLFPSAKAKTLSETLNYDSKSNTALNDSPLKCIIVVDGSWGQVKSILHRLPFLKTLLCIKLSSQYQTVFWRTQIEDSSYLATIEAIYYFYVEYAKGTNSDGEYSGQYDDLMLLFKFFYELIQKEQKT